MERLWLDALCLGPHGPWRSASFFLYRERQAGSDGVERLPDMARERQATPLKLCANRSVCCIAPFFLRAVVWYTRFHGNLATKSSQSSSRQRGDGLCAKRETPNDAKPFGGRTHSLKTLAITGSPLVETAISKLTKHTFSALRLFGILSLCRRRELRLTSMYTCEDAVGREGNTPIRG